MALIVGTNSYVDAAFITQYATDRGITLTGDADQLGLRAMDYLETQTWKGTKTDANQPLEWPRSGVYVQGVLIDSSTVPSDIEKAQAQLSIEIDQGNDPNAVLGRSTKREKLDALEVEYMDNASNSFYSPLTGRYINKYLASANSGYSFNVVRV